MKTSIFLLFQIYYFLSLSSSSLWAQGAQEVYNWVDDPGTFKIYHFKELRAKWEIDQSNLTGSVSPRKKIQIDHLSPSQLQSQDSALDEGSFLVFSDYKDGPASKVLLHSLIVTFKNEITPEKIKAFAKTHQLRPFKNQPPAKEKTWYFETGPGLFALEISNQINRSRDGKDNVLIATPNWLNLNWQLK